MAKYSTFKYDSATKYGATANPVGELTWIFQVDWDGDGTVDGANEAEYMIDLTIDRGERHYITRSGNFEVPGEGTFTATMDNSTGRYNPYNTTSALYPYVKPGRLCLISVKDNASNTTWRRFTGYILDIRPDPNKDTVKIEGVDGWGRLKGAKVSVQNAFINRGLSECITSMLLASNVPWGGWQINADTQPVRVFYVDKEDAGSVLTNLAQAGLGHIFFDRYNRPVFYPRNYAGMTTHTLDQAQVHREIISSQPWDLIGNYVTVIAHRIVKERLSSIWSLADPIYLASGASATITTKYDPSVEISADYDAWTNINGTGTNLKANFAVVATSSTGTSQTTFTITNNSSQNGYLTELTMYGRKLADRPLEYVTEDTTSQQEFGVRYFLHDTPYLQSRNYASSFSGTIEAFLDDIQRELTIRIEQRPSYQYPPDLRDKVAFTSAALEIDTTYSIIGMRDEWTRDSGQAVHTTLYLSPVIYDNTSITPEPIDEEQPIPEVPPDEPPDGSGSGGTDPPDGDIDPPDPGEAVAVLSTGGSVYVTPDFGAASPTWTSKTFSGDTIIDFDVSNDRNIALAISGTKIYKVSDLLPVAPSSWTEVYSASADFDGTAPQLLRVHWSPVSADTVFVLASCQNATTATESDAWMLKSTDAGETWTQNLIKLNAGTRTDYTVTTGIYSTSWNAGQADFYTDDIYIERVGDDVAGTYNPWAMAFRKTYVCTSEIDVYIQSDTDHINNFSESTDVATSGDVTGWKNNLLSAGDQTTASGWMDDYFGTWILGAAASPMPKEDARTKTKFRVDIQSFNPQPAGSLTIIVYVFWNKPDPGIPKAFDVANNGNWLYVGFDNSISKSEDGGVNWFDLTTLDGAFDLCVDPQLAGMVYYWSDDGHIQYINAGTLGAISGLTETANEIPIRIAKSQNSGQLWVVTEGQVYKHELGAWSSQDTFSSPGRSLRSYTGGTGQRLIYADAISVQYSDDAGATWSDKTGSLSSISPVTVHLLE